ncbi:hypothetical protein [Streptomyces sp. NBC_00118]|uniref:hypothetical protein n=1 Tax=Streptomyces sp. NBC_00118 TaxID=2975658 RepID=UPI003248008A
MALLADRLAVLAAAGESTLTLDAVGLPAEQLQDEVSAVAAGPMAPLLAEAVTHALDSGDPTWAEAAQGFARGFADQHSVLALSQSLETLLGSAAAAKAIGKTLNSALLDGLPDTVTSGPLLAAARLEGAVRLAASQAVRPYQVWEVLEELPADGPDDFLERLPRILGVALDCWAQQEETVTTAIRELLTRLSVDEAADVDALFELGCDRLRSALSASDLSRVSTQIVEARGLFAAAEAAEEARDDAAAYLAVCDAVLGFTAGNSTQVAEAADRIEAALERRTAWLHGAHQPSWLQPRRSAELAWSGLVLRLRAAAQALGASVWMNSWEALDAVLAAYSAARTVQPLGTDQQLPGLAAMVEPAIEEGVVRRQAFLSALRHAVTHPDEYVGPLFDAATASTVLQRIDAREATSPSTGDEPTNQGDDDPDGPGSHRLYRLAPTVVRQLGLDQALRLFSGLDDTALAVAEGLAHNGDVARLRASDPLIVPLLDAILRELSEHPAFIGEVRQTFGLLVEQTLLFLKSRSDLTRTSLFGAGKKDDPKYDYRRKPEKGQREAAEADLQRDFHGWLLAGPLHGIVQVEPIDVGMGRADVMVHFGALRYLTEMKQDGNNNSRAYIEEKYLTQEAEYTNTNAPFGQLLVLDLTKKTDAAGTRRIDELSWVASLRPKGADIERYVLAGIVTGNRITPSAYSAQKK